MKPPRPTVEREGDAVVIRIPMTLKRRGGRKEVLVPEGLPTAAPSKSPTQEPLVTALARAHVWQELLDNGRYGSIADLAGTSTWTEPTSPAPSGWPSWPPTSSRPSSAATSRAGYL